MPGLTLYIANNTTGNPQTRNGLAASNLTGTPTTTVPGYMRQGDPVVLTTATALTSGGIPVLRSLLTTDVTGGYSVGGLLAVPTAPTLAAVTAASYGVPYLANGTYYVLLTWNTATGQTSAGAATANATTGSSTQAILVTPPTAPTGATSYNVYASAVGTTTPFFLQYTGVPIGNEVAIGGDAGSNALNTSGPAPPTKNTATSGGLGGIFGVAQYDLQTNGSGAQTAAVPSGGGPANPPNGFAPKLLGMATGFPVDTNTGRQNPVVYSMEGGNQYLISLSSTSAAATWALVGAQIAMTSTISGSAQYWYGDTTNATQPIWEVLSPNVNDPLYGLVGGSVIVALAGTYNQALPFNGPYTNH